MRLGVDIGGVIIKRISDVGDTSVAAAVAETPEEPGALAAIKTLVELFEGNVWLVSKCYESMQKKTWKWLRHHKFFAQTGVLPSRVLFCHERAWKTQICVDLGITHFIDDRIDVLEPMRNGVVSRVFQFGVEETASWATPLPDWSWAFRLFEVAPGRETSP